MNIDSSQTPSFNNSSSTVNLAVPKYPQGTMSIADQVIEEVDEQLTIQSMRAQEKRPTAQSIFAQQEEKPPIRSAPIDMPAHSHHNADKIGYERIQSVMQPEHHPYMFPSNVIFSSSAPEENIVHSTTPKINIDHFDDLMEANPKPSPKEGMKFFFLNSLLFF